MSVKTYATVCDSDDGRTDSNPGDCRPQLDRHSEKMRGREKDRLKATLRHRKEFAKETGADVSDKRGFRDAVGADHIARGQRDGAVADGLSGMISRYKRSGELPRIAWARLHSVVCREGQSLAKKQHKWLAGMMHEVLRAGGVAMEDRARIIRDLLIRAGVEQNPGWSVIETLFLVSALHVHVAATMKNFVGAATNFTFVLVVITCAGVIYWRKCSVAAWAFTYWMGLVYFSCLEAVNSAGLAAVEDWIAHQSGPHPIYDDWVASWQGGQTGHWGAAIAVTSRFAIGVMVMAAPWFAVWGAHDWLKARERNKLMHALNGNVRGVEKFDCAMCGHSYYVCVGKHNKHAAEHRKPRSERIGLWDVRGSRPHNGTLRAAEEKEMELSAPAPAACSFILPAVPTPTTQAAGGLDDKPKIVEPDKRPLLIKRPTIISAPPVVCAPAPSATGLVPAEARLPEARPYIIGPGLGEFSHVLTIPRRVAPDGTPLHTVLYERLDDWHTRRATHWSLSPIGEWVAPVRAKLVERLRHERDEISNFNWQVVRENVPQGVVGFAARPMTPEQLSRLRRPPPPPAPPSHLGAPPPVELLAADVVTPHRDEPVEDGIRLVPRHYPTFVWSMLAVTWMSVKTELVRTELNGEPDDQRPLTVRHIKVIPSRVVVQRAKLYTLGVSPRRIAVMATSLVLVCVFKWLWAEGFSLETKTFVSIACLILDVLTRIPLSIPRLLVWGAWLATKASLNADKYVSGGNVNTIIAALFQLAFVLQFYRVRILFHVPALGSVLLCETWNQPFSAAVENAQSVLLRSATLLLPSAYYVKVISDAEEVMKLLRDAFNSRSPFAKGISGFHKRAVRAAHGAVISQYT